MIYAKLNSDGTVEQFPYRFDSRPGNELPDNVVEVDTISNRPSVSWSQKLLYDTVNLVDDTYVLSYTVADRFADADAKLKGIQTLKKQHEQTNERQFVAKANALLKEYPAVERETWPQQRTEALAYQTDNTVNTPLLSVMATARDITVAEMVTKVLEKVTSYETQYGELLGKYQHNREVLASISFDDETTWDSIDTLVGL